jgi:hypothetical protein
MGLQWAIRTIRFFLLDMYLEVRTSSFAEIYVKIIVYTGAQFADPQLLFSPLAVAVDAADGEEGFRSWSRALSGASGWIGASPPVAAWRRRLWRGRSVSHLPRTTHLYRRFPYDPPVIDCCEGIGIFVYIGLLISNKEVHLRNLALLPDLAAHPVS